MQTTSKTLALNVLKKKCEQLDQRYPGYRTDAVRRLGAILQLEKEAAPAIINRISDELTSFGKELETKSGSSEGGA